MKRTSFFVLYFTGFEKNFDSYGPDRVDSAEEPYDFDSLMHYDNQAFSKNGENTLQAISDPDRHLGNMDDFSAIDIKQLLKHYPCKAWDRKPGDNGGQRKAEESKCTGTPLQLKPSARLYNFKPISYLSVYYNCAGFIQNQS